ncbi:MAG: hypothetical protein WBF17_10880 [Phycisphaerae bacterium]
MRTRAEMAREDKPLFLSADYSLITDDTGEKDSKLSHQLGLGADYRLGTMSSVGALVWLEWCNAPPANGDDHGRELHRADYSAYWLFQIEPIRTTVEAGWIGQTYPNSSGDPAFTHEWYLALTIDDSKWFRTDMPVLNPYLAYYMDMDDVRGSWMELGISHCFFLAQMGLEKTPLLKDLSITPSFLMGVDHRQVKRSTRLATLQYGLDICLDLSSALNIPPEHGRLTLSGFLYFRDSLGEMEDEICDRLYGGLRLGYYW